MINPTLFRKELKSNYILLLIFLAVLTMYATMIIAMFDPKLGDSLRAMSESMPQLFSAFGMADVGTTLLEFITGYLYGMLFIAFPGVFIIILSNRLVAKYVDNGSMAYLLSVPSKRSRLARTQAFFMITCLFLLALYVTVLILACSELLFPGELETAAYLRVSFGHCGVLIFFGGLGFFCTCFFNESRHCTGTVSAIVIYSILVQMISQAGDKFEKVKYATPLTLFDMDGLAASDAGAWAGCLTLYLIGIIGYIAGITFFGKKNLSI